MGSQSKNTEVVCHSLLQWTTSNWKILKEMGIPDHLTCLLRNLWFYFHLCMWEVHSGLLLRLPWRTWVCPSEGQVWRSCSCLGCRGSGTTRYSGELVARLEGNIVL